MGFISPLLRGRLAVIACGCAGAGLSPRRRGYHAPVLQPGDVSWLTPVGAVTRGLF